MKWGIVVFPGSNCDHDCYWVIKNVLKEEVLFLWHKEEDLKNCDVIILPGGFSYGDYLRTGVMAALSPIMNSIKKFAEEGGIILGICNGFQILLEANLLSGAMMINKSLKFICDYVYLRVENNDNPFTCLCKKGEILKIPIAHYQGNYYNSDSELKKLIENNQIIFKYCNNKGEITDEANPNGSLLNIAGIINAKGNILGMMPHPERCSEEILGSTDGLKIFKSIQYAWLLRSKNNKLIKK